MYVRSLFFICLTLFSIDALADFITPNDRVTRHVNVRGAASNGNNIGKLFPGDFAELTGEHGRYYKIMLPTGISGFVAKSWTTLVQADSLADSATGKLELHFIDVGQGDSTLVRCPNGKNILVDAGSNSGGSPEEVSDYISEVVGDGLIKIDTLVITHADGDHYNLIQDSLLGMPVGQIFHVGYQNHYKLKIFWAWLQSFPSERVTRLGKDYYDKEGSPNSQINCGDAKVYVLAADIRSNSSWKNARSIVLLFKYGEFEAVLTGDATKATERAIMARYSDSFLDVDLLKVGHHGSLATSTSQGWTDALSPEIAVISSGKKNGYGHPRYEVIDRLDEYTLNNAEPHTFTSATRPSDGYNYQSAQEYNEQIYGTADSGNVVVITGGKGTFEVSTKHHGEF